MSQRAAVIAGSAVVLALALGGCSSASVHPGASPGGGSSGGTGGGAGPSSQGSPGAHDDLLVRAGQEADLTLPDGRTVIGRIRVTSVEVDPGCQGSAAQPATQGHYVVVDVTAAATKDLNRAVPSVLPLAWALWKIWGPDGQPIASPFGTGITCPADGQLLDATLQPGQQASGQVVFDVPVTSGTVGIAVPGTQAAFEWPFG